MRTRCSRGPAAFEDGCAWVVFVMAIRPIGGLELDITELFKSDGRTDGRTDGKTGEG